MNLKKVSVFTFLLIIAFGGMIPFASAAEVEETASSDSAVEVSESSASLEQLIERIKEIFPGRFDKAAQQDFQLDNFQFEEEEGKDIVRVSYFNSSSLRNQQHANFEFMGEDLQLMGFYYNNDNQPDAMYPPKTSKDEAAKIAKDFIDKVNQSDNYQLVQNSTLYDSDMNKPLTEPIEYQFSFEKLKDGIPVQNQTLNVSVLGNGDISQYNVQWLNSKVEYEAAEGLLSKEVLLEKLKADIGVELQYMVQQNYNTGENAVYLAYLESPVIQGVSAKDGKYYINGEYTEEIPKQEATKMLDIEKRKPESITKEEARALAKEILATDEEGTVLNIEGIIERENADKKTVYDIQYMYQMGNSGYGSNIQISKETGELLSFHDINFNYNPNEEIIENFSSEEALEIAVDYIEKFAYTNSDEYSYPVALNTNLYIGYGNQYYFSFPRVKDELFVSGNSIDVGISKEDGKLTSFNIQHSAIDEWPSVENVVSKEKALQAIQDKIDLKLHYVDPDINGQNGTGNNTLQYKLSYLKDNGNYPSFYNAISGEWENSDPYSDNGQSSISHPWAEEELNLLINNNIINVDDPESFDGDKVVTKGEGLEILIKSITQIYNDPYNEQFSESSFTNIDSNHPQFYIIEQAVESGILSTDKNTFDVDAKLTRENLAYWYIRALGYDQIAQNDALFNYQFNDMEDVSDGYKGHAALAESLGIFTLNDESQFLPQGEVSYAKLAVTNLRFAKIMATVDNYNNY